MKRAKTGKKRGRPKIVRPEPVKPANTIIQPLTRAKPRIKRTKACPPPTPKELLDGKFSK